MGITLRLLPVAADHPTRGREALPSESESPDSSMASIPWDRVQILSVALQFDQMVEGVGAASTGRSDQSHEQITVTMAGRDSLRPGTGSLEKSP
jgi:hypothetical protein